MKKIESGLWLLEVVGKNPKTGQRKHVKRRFKGTEAEAWAEEQRVRDELQSGGPAQRLTLGAFAASWLQLRAGSLRQSTLEKYANDLRTHILPVLGPYYLDMLRPSDVQAYINGDKGAGHSVQNRLRLLRVLAKDAIAEGVSQLDWTARVTAKAGRKYTEEDPNLLSPPQLVALLEATPARWRPLVQTMAFTGLRWGEASGLQWGDIDETVGVLRVRRNNWRGTIGETKTEQGRRIVPLVAPVKAALLTQRGLVKRNVPWIFPTDSGRLHRSLPLREVLEVACTAAKVPRITAHGLRRTYNDILRRVTSGIVARSIVGHASEAMTERYSVVDVKEKLLAAESVVQIVLASKVEDKVETERPQQPLD